MSAKLWVRSAVCVLALFVLSPAYATPSRDIVVKGARSPTNPKVFTWSVTNNGRQPITMFRAQHFLGNYVIPPDGWIQSDMTGNIPRGQKFIPGYVECKSTSAMARIQAGQTKEFQLRLLREWHGTVTRQAVVIGLANGEEVEIPDVLCPAKQPFLQRNVAAIALGAVFAVVLALKWLRGRKQACVSDSLRFRD